MVVGGRRKNRKKFITYLSTSVRRLLDKGITLRQCTKRAENLLYCAHKETRLRKQERRKELKMMIREKEEKASTCSFHGVWVF